MTRQEALREIAEIEQRAEFEVRQSKGTFAELEALRHARLTERLIEALCDVVPQCPCGLVLK